MNEAIAPSVIPTIDQEIVRKSDGSADFLISDELTCQYDRGTRILWSKLAPQGIPCFSPQLLRDMERASAIVEGYFLGHEVQRPLRYIVVYSGVPGVFSLGGDLGYFQRLIASQDRARLIEYGRSAINTTFRNYNAHNLNGVTTIALLEGDALGGGFECARSCDLVIAERHIKCSFPEVLFDMFPGMGAMSFLSRRVPRKILNDLTRSGRQFSADELLNMGVIDKVVDTGRGRDAVARLTRKWEYQHEAHSAMNGVDRLLNPVTITELNEVVRLWVDCALRLSPRGLEWMRRLHKQQLSTFGVGLALVQGSSKLAVA